MGSVETPEIEPIGVTVERLREAIVDLHSEDFEYHNYNHALETFEAAKSIADVAEENGLILDRRVMYAAAFFHDTNFHKPTPAEYEGSKEAYSAAIAAKSLPALGYSPKEIQHVHECIMITQFSDDPKQEELLQHASPEAIAVFRADIINLTWDYEAAKAKTIAYWYETIRSKPELKFEDWMARSLQILRIYIARNWTIGSWELNDTGLHSDQVKAAAVVDRLEAETPTIAAELAAAV